MQIGKYQLANQVILAPMAGVTDRPFRQLCKRLGAGMAVSEMVGANSLLRGSAKTQRRTIHTGEAVPRSVQIAGACPQMLAAAARYNEEQGAEIIDINMGCPAKKICKMLSGSALLRDEKLVADILSTVVQAVKIPVTLKIRTGWDKEHKNGIRIARLAEESGIQALAVHGRTRQCFFKGHAEFATIKEIKEAVNIPVIANGDITTPLRAREVLEYTGADGIMIGRAAQGRPWIFREIVHFLETGTYLPPPTALEICEILTEHMENLYLFYGEETGVKIARKHVGWYTKGQRNGASFRANFNQVLTAAQQLSQVQDFFEKNQELV